MSKRKSEEFNLPGIMDAAAYTVVVVLALELSAIILWSYFGTLLRVWEHK